jgi:hypothetical protein
MEQSLPSEANNLSAIHIHRLLCNTKFYYRFHKILTLVPILCHMDHVHTLTPCYYHGDHLTYFNYSQV